MVNLIELAQTDPQKARKRVNQIRNAEYLRGFIDGAIAVISPKDVVLEFGANVGEFTLRLAHSGAKVRAYEADPVAAEQLKTNMTVRENVEIFSFAVGTVAGKMPLYRASDFSETNLPSTQSSTIRDLSDKGFTQADDVEVKNAIEIIEAAIAEYGDIALLAMDINGSEMEILDELFKKELFGKIRVSIVTTYQKDRRDQSDHYRELRLRAEGRPEWSIKFHKA